MTVRVQALNDGGLSDSKFDKKIFTPAKTPRLNKEVEVLSVQNTSVEIFVPAVEDGKNDT